MSSNNDIGNIFDSSVVRTSKPKKNIFSNVESKNPLYDQIKDPSELKSFYKKREFIPFAGTCDESGDSLLHFFMDMAELSPTHGACIEYQKIFSLGGKIDIVKSTDYIFDIDDEDEVNRNTKIELAEFINNIDINLGDIASLSDNLFTSYKATGNAYVSLVMTESLGIKKAYIKFINPDYCRYVNTSDQSKVIAISPYWNKSYLEKKPANRIPVFPEYEVEKGTMRTIFHIKNGNGLYGRPDSLASFMYWYREFQDANYLIKESDNGWTGKVLIETEADDPETDYTDDNGDFDKTADRIEANFTNKGDDPMSIVYMERPSGSRPAYVYQFRPNTNENFYNVSGKISEDKIIRSHKWSRRLLGDSVSNGLSSNVFLDELKTKMPVIIDNQLIVDEAINKILNEVITFMGRNDLSGIAIRHKTPFQHLLDENINISNGHANNGMGSSKK